MSKNKSKFKNIATGVTLTLATGAVVLGCVGFSQYAGNGFTGKPAEAAEVTELKGQVTDLKGQVTTLTGQVETLEQANEALAGNNAVATLANTYSTISLMKRNENESWGTDLSFYVNKKASGEVISNSSRSFDEVKSFIADFESATATKGLLLQGDTNQHFEINIPGVTPANTDFVETYNIRTLELHTNSTNYSLTFFVDDEMLFYYTQADMDKNTQLLEQLELEKDNIWLNTASIVVEHEAGVYSIEIYLTKVERTQ